MASIRRGAPVVARAGAPTSRGPLGRAAAGLAEDRSLHVLAVVLALACAAVVAGVVALLAWASVTLPPASRVACAEIAECAPAPGPRPALLHDSWRHDLQALQ